MNAKSLITKARSRLGDKNKKRWTDERLLEIVSEGQIDLCKLSGIYRKETYISITNGITRYELPDNCFKVRRLEFNGKAVPLVSRNDIDDQVNINHELVGIKDDLTMGLLDIYPEPENFDSGIIVIEGIETDDTFSISPIFGVVTSSNEFTLSSDYGVLVTDFSFLVEEASTLFGEITRAPLSPPLELSANSEYGVTVGMEYGTSTDPSLYGFITRSETYEVAGQYGLVADVTLKEYALRVFYEAVTQPLTYINASLSIPDVWEKCLIRYIVGTALQDDNDSSNIQRGEMELAKYVAEATGARDMASKDFSGSTKNKYITKYRRM